MDERLNRWIDRGIYVGYVVFAFATIAAIVFIVLCRSDF